MSTEPLIKHQSVNHSTSCHSSLKRASSPRSGTVTFLDFTNPDAAYILGLLQTDGSHSGNLDGKGAISLELKKSDSEILYKLSDVIEFNSSVYARKRTTNFSKDYESSIFNLHNQTARRRLFDAGLLVGKKSKVVSCPTIPFSEPDYVRGLLDGDGSVGFTQTNIPFVSFITASPSLAGYIEDVILRVTGVVRNTQPNTRDSVYNIMVTNKAAAALAGWAWYKNSYLYIPRKYESARKVSEWTIPPEKAGLYGVKKTRWTPEEDKIVLEKDQTEAARILKRTVSSVSIRKWRLKHRN